MKKILIVDDSIIYRHALNSALSEGSRYIVAGTVKNGKEALDFLIKNPVDLITLDIEMPVMNGFELIERLSTFPAKPKIIIFTSKDFLGAENALKALKLGADDFLTKVEGDGNVEKSIGEIKSLLVPKIEALLSLKSEVSADVGVIRLPQVSLKNKFLKKNYDYILIGSSTGGPEALRYIFNFLNGKNLVPIFIVQHMPPIYTKQLAKNLSETTNYNVIEATQGQIVEAGYCYVAPGDYHMELEENSDGKIQIVLNQKEKECFVRPAVNALFRSSKFISKRSLYIVLTGMGSDGLNGVREIPEADVVIQDEGSSVVWGMPGEIFKENLHTQMNSLPKIRELVESLIK